MTDELQDTVLPDREPPPGAPRLEPPLPSRGSDGRLRPEPPPPAAVRGVVEPRPAAPGAPAEAPDSRMPTNAIAGWGKAVMDEMERAIVGKREALHLLLTGLLANGHVLLEDNPGLAKTLLARSLGQVADLRFSRVQFTPDLVPGDITGSSVLDLQTRQPVFKPGPIFANLVLGDEINRAPPKTQAALLEAMEERQVTVDGISHPLTAPFLVIATQNPIESGGTYPLPEAQLDRFLLKFGLGYPTLEQETEIVMRRAGRAGDGIELNRVIDAATLLKLQASVETIHVDPTVAGYMTALVHATRQSTRTRAGASPRGSLALLKASRAWAGLAGRDFVTPDDVQAVAVPALAHRIIINPDDWLRGVSAEDIVRDCLSQVAAPVAVSG